MTFLRNAWYIAAWSEELEPGQLHARTFLNEPVVLYRTMDGSVAALLDRCPHRFAPLHLGRLRENNRLRCAYHGLEFDTGGTCVKNPHDSGRIPPTMKVRSYPLVERHAAVWIWMGEQPADPSKIPDLSVLDSAPAEHTSGRDYIKMDAGYELIIYNLLDLSHVSFLHEGVLGNDDMIQAQTKTEQIGNSVLAHRSMPNIQASPFHQLLLGIDFDGADANTKAKVYEQRLGNRAGRGDAWADMHWFMPSSLLNDSGICPPGAARSEGTGAIGAHLLTPETDTTTHYFFCAARRNPVVLSPEADVVVRRQLGEVRRIAFDEQDRPILEGQQRNVSLAGPGIKPVLLPTDSSAARCQRILEQHIAAEQAAAAHPITAST